MPTVGRVAVLISILGTVLMLATMLLRPEGWVVGRPGITMRDAVAFSSVLCMPLAWVIALLHWGVHYHLPHKRRWGVVVVRGLVLGAAAYLFHPRGAAAAHATREQRGSGGGADLRA